MPFFSDTIHNLGTMENRNLSIFGHSRFSKQISILIADQELHVSKLESRMDTIKVNTQNELKDQTKIIEYSLRTKCQLQHQGLNASYKGKRPYYDNNQGSSQCLQNKGKDVLVINTLEEGPCKALWWQKSIGTKLIQLMLSSAHS